MRWPKPSPDEIREALAREYPSLAAAEVTYVDQGWDFWAFTVGEYLVRAPINDWYVGRLERERELMPLLRERLPAPVPVPNLFVEDGPKRKPLSGYLRVPGVSLYRLGRSPAPGFGAALGRFLRALHAFPPEEALRLGFELVDGPRLRVVRAERYESAALNIFPLLSCETRTYVEYVYGGYLNEASNFDFEPRLCHGDIDDRNTLADPETGALTGVIDFLDADVCNPASDFAWAVAGGFERLGIADQIPELLREGGAGEREVASFRTTTPVFFALADIMHGLEIDDEDFVVEGLERLNGLVPRGLRCP